MSHQGVTRMLFQPMRAVGLAMVLGIVSLSGGGVFAQSYPPVTLDLTGLGANDPEARKIAVTLAPGIRSNHDLKEPNLRSARTKMIDGEAVATDALRALADAGDGIAALRLIAQLRDEGHTAAPENLAHYYGIAATTGRVAGLSGLVRTLDQVDPAATTPARLALLKTIVMAYAQAGNSIAAAGMMRFHLSQRPFGAMPQDITRLAKEGQSKGNAVIALQLAGDLIQMNWDDAAALTQAQGYLRAAADATTSVRVQLITGNLLPVLEARIHTLTQGSDTDLAELSQ